MKKAILLACLLYASTSLNAGQSTKFELYFDNIKSSFKDIPIFGIKMTYESLKKYGFIVSYANNLYSKSNKFHLDNDYKVQNIQFGLIYKF